MIAGTFHEGSGLGNQLHRYVMTRVLAEDKGYDWGMICPGGKQAAAFKGSPFMDIAFHNNCCTLKPGQFIDSVGLSKIFIEKKVVENGIDIRGYDPEINFVEDGTLIDGEFQDEKYFGHRLDDIRRWLKVEPLDMPDDLCVINFRGGEYTVFPELFLLRSYWDTAIEIKRRYEPGMRFQVHTDDISTAQQFFPDFECVHDIGLNWRSIRYAKHLILSNSSFGILPALLNEDVKEVIAPRYWARHNTQTWALPQNYYKKFMYA